MDQKTKDLCAQMAQTMHRFIHMRPGANQIPEEVSPAEMGALMGIHMCRVHNKECRPGFMARKMGISKSAMSQTLTGLENKGFITRSHAKEDSRSVDLKITEAGTAVIEKADAMRDASMGAMVQSIGPERIEQWIITLEEIIDYQQKEGFENTKEAPCE